MTLIKQCRLFELVLVIGLGKGPGFGWSKAQRATASIGLGLGLVLLLLYLDPRSIPPTTFYSCCNTLVCCTKNSAQSLPTPMHTLLRISSSIRLRDDSLSYMYMYSRAPVTVVLDFVELWRMLDLKQETYWCCSQCERPHMLLYCKVCKYLRCLCVPLG